MRALAVALLLGACGSPPEPAAAPEPVTVPEPAADSAEPDAEPPPPAAPEPVTTKVDGLEIEVLAEGRGPGAAAGDRVLVHYDGTLPDGTRFDSSRERGQPLELVLGKKMLIAGFERAVIGMRPGGVRRVTIPPELGYGERGRPPKIPPAATLIFEIELVEIR